MKSKSYVCVFCYTDAMNDFVIHACEQVLRFTSVNKWGDLSEKLKVQLSFNMGVIALGLDLTKEEGYQSIADTCQEDMSVQELHKHLRSLIVSNEINVSEVNIAKPF